MNHKNKRIAGIVLLIALCASVSYAQRQFTQTVTSTNRSCNSTCTVLDVGDNTNPALITFVTPVLVNSVNPNPNPIGAYWMYQNKWSIYNLNGIAMPLGAKFNVEYDRVPGLQSLCLYCSSTSPLVRCCRHRHRRCYG